MFDDERVPLKVAAVDHKIGNDDEREFPLVVISFELNPLTSERTGQVSEFMKAMLFTRGDATVNQQLESAAFNVVGEAQTLVCYVAPDGGESFTLDEVEIGHLHARRSKNTSAWKLAFTATLEPTGERQLAQIVDSLTKMRYVTFGDAHPNLVSKAEKEERAEKRGRRPAGGDAAAATH